MKKIFILMVSLIIPILTRAEPIVDMYGADRATTQKFIKKYAKEVAGIEGALLKEAMKAGTNVKQESSSLEKLFFRKMALVEKIKKEGGFLFADIQTITYGDDKNPHTTIEVISKNQPDRLRFVNPQSGPEHRPEPTSGKKDLIDKMLEYNEVGFPLYFSQSVARGNQTCPVFHCFLGFSHPKLKPYLQVFNTGVVKEKQLVLDTLANDPDSDRRAAAAFLVGHFKNPREVISVMTQRLDEKDDRVRNNIMRVMAATMDKAKIYQIDIKPFIGFMDSPYNTDRNKAMYVLSQAIKQENMKPLVRQQTKDILPRLLELKQPNNHDSAYEMLKNITGKDLGEHNVTAWKNLLNSTTNPIV